MLTSGAGAPVTSPGRPGGNRGICHREFIKADLADLQCGSLACPDTHLKIRVIFAVPNRKDQLTRLPARSRAELKLAPSDEMPRVVTDDFEGEMGQDGHASIKPRVDSYRV